MAGTQRSLEKPLLLGTLTLSVTFNVLLSSVGRVARHPPSLLLQSGDVAPALEVTSPAGATVPIDFAAGPEGTILYFFAPNSRHSQENAPAFERVASAVSHRFQIVRLIPDGEDLPLIRGPYGSADLYAVSTAARQAYKLQGLPQTFVIDRSGTVRANWIGTFSGTTALEVESTLGLQPPPRSR